MSYKISACVFFLFNVLIGLQAQNSDSLIRKAVAAIVQLDPVVITASKSGFDIEDFIRLVQEDESLYAAFRNLRVSTYDFRTQMTFYDKKGRIASEYSATARQTFDGQCREMEILDEHFDRRFFKGKQRKYKYYTARLYDRVFVTHGKVCEGGNRTTTNTQSSDKTESQVSELKKLIFTPGRQANVPLIGKKTEIFSDRMIPYYDFHIRSDTVGQIPVYVFEASVKDAFKTREGATVFQRLVTYFSKADFQVVARRYHLSHRNLLYMFDVQMEVDLGFLDGSYYPVRISYAGTWNVPMRAKEQGAFTVHISSFQ